MTTILSRKAWTSTAPGGAAFNYARFLGIVAHYPAAGRAIGVISREAEAARLRGWRNYHVNGRGWADLGYNWAIGQSGRIWTGRGHRVGAHATGHNSTTQGVLFIVGDNEALTPAAKRAFRDLRAHLRQRRDRAAVWGHQQMAGASTRCPGPYIMGSIRDGSLTSGSTTPTPTPTPPKDWFDMATAAELRKIIREEIDKKLGSPARQDLADIIKSHVPQADFAAFQAEKGDPARINVAAAGRTVQRVEKISREGRTFAANALTVARENRAALREVRTELASVQALVETVAEYGGVDREDVAAIIKNAAERALANVEITLASVSEVAVDDEPRD